MSLQHRHPTSAQAFGPAQLRRRVAGRASGSPAAASLPVSVTWIAASSTPSFNGRQRRCRAEDCSAGHRSCVPCGTRRGRGGQYLCARLRQGRPLPGRRPAQQRCVAPSQALCTATAAPRLSLWKTDVGKRICPAPWPACRQPRNLATTAICALRNTVLGSAGDSLDTALGVLGQLAVIDGEFT